MNRVRKCVFPVAGMGSRFLPATKASPKEMMPVVDKAYEVEAELAARGKTELLKLVQGIIPKHINCIYIRQPEALGLGHAVLCAEPVVHDETFAIILADDLIDAEPPVLKQMTQVYEHYQCSVLGVDEVPREHTRQYGIV